jgi:pyruvate formate lyase activating enzyme
MIKQVPDYIDLAIADLKLFSSNLHRQWTGADNADILETIRFWSQTMPLWVSIPVIPGVQREAEWIKMADFLSALPLPPAVRFIPYHQFGDSKYRAMGNMPPIFEGSVEAPIASARAIFSQRDLQEL